MKVYSMLIGILCLCCYMQSSYANVLIGGNQSLYYENNYLYSVVATEIYSQAYVYGTKTKYAPHVVGVIAGTNVPFYEESKYFQDKVDTKIVSEFIGVTSFIDDIVIEVRAIDNKVGERMISRGNVDLAVSNEKGITAHLSSFQKYVSERLLRILQQTKLSIEGVDEYIIGTEKISNKHRRGFDIDLSSFLSFRDMHEGERKSVIAEWDWEFPQEPILGENKKGDYYTLVIVDYDTGYGLIDIFDLRHNSVDLKSRDFFDIIGRDVRYETKGIVTVEGS